MLPPGRPAGSGNTAAEIRRGARELGGHRLRPVHHRPGVLGAGRGAGGGRPFDAARDFPGGPPRRPRPCPADRGDQPADAPLPRGRDPGAGAARVRARRPRDAAHPLPQGAAGLSRLGAVRLRPGLRVADPQHRGDGPGAAAAPNRDPPRCAAGAAPRDGADRRSGQHRDRAAVRPPGGAAAALRLRVDDGGRPPAGMARRRAGAHRRDGRRPGRSRLGFRSPLRRQQESGPAAVRRRGRQSLAGSGKRGLGGDEAQGGRRPITLPAMPWSSWSTCTTPACVSSPSTASSSRPTPTSCCRRLPATAARGGRISRSPILPTGSSGRRRGRASTAARSTCRSPPTAASASPPSTGRGSSSPWRRCRASSEGPGSGTTASTTSTAATGWKSSPACPATSASSPRPSTSRACSAPSSATAPCRGSRSPWERRRRSGYYLESRRIGE